jgi:TolB-like protein
LSGLFEELKRRNVFRVAVAYVVLAWVVLQITDLMAPALHLPEWTLSLVAFLGIIGFPFALLLAWAFELTPEGIKRSEDVTPEDSITGSTAGNLNKVIIGLLCVAVVTLLADRFLGLSQRLGGGAHVEATADASAGEEPPATAVEPDDGPRSIAVLPFVNMSGDSEQEYFSDGISEELLNALAQIRELRVAARTSSFAFKGQNQDITKIGEQLKVETVLEGSVRKSGMRVRVVAQLINVEDGYHLWSDSYDRDLTDIFAVQDEISAAIVEALRVHLTDSELPKSNQEADIAAYNLYLQARHSLRKRTRDSLQLAVQQYQQALDIDENYAPAWAGIALATQLLNENGYGDIPLREAADQAQGYLDTAFSIDPALAEAHAAQALVLMDLGQYREAIASIDRALESMPSEGILYSWRSNCLDALGEYDQAVAALERAFEIDPLHPAVRTNWMRHRASLGDVESLRQVTTPGTPEYYYAEREIARAEGRWADMYLLMKEAGEVFGTSDRYQVYLGETMFFFLGERERGALDMPSLYDQFNRARADPAAAVDELGAIEPAALTDEQRQILLQAMAWSRRCGRAGELLAPLRLETREDYGGLKDWTSPYANAAWLAWCLYDSGEIDRARALANRLTTIAEEAAENGLSLRDRGDILVMLQVVLGNTQQVLAITREMLDRHWMLPIAFTVMPYHAQLAGQADYQRLMAELQQKLNSERQKLGWPPKALEDI